MATVTDDGDGYNYVAMTTTVTMTVAMMTTMPMRTMMLT